MCAGTVNDINENPVLIKQRQLQLQKRRMEYQWQRHSLWGLPSSIDDSTEAIPRDEKFERAKQFHMALTGLTSKAKVTIHTVFRHIADIHDYKKLATIIEDPALDLFENDRWKSDVEFGRQILNGLNPIVIERCVNLPAKFPVTNNMLEGILCRGLSLEQEIEVRFDIVYRPPKGEEKKCNCITYRLSLSSVCLGFSVCLITTHLNQAY